jgi:hypothetical protein
VRKFVKGAARRRFRPGEEGTEGAGTAGGGANLLRGGPAAKPGVSHARALESAWLAPPADQPLGPPYDPTVLDDPELTTGRHRTVMNLPCFRASIIPYVKGGVLKAELNEHFRAQHPTVPPSLTLSKIRKLKRVMLELCMEENVELSSIALAYVYFEKLVLRSEVTKENRRALAAGCVLLAVKFNDRKCFDPKAVLPFVNALEKRLNITVKGMRIETERERRCLDLLF